MGYIKQKYEGAKLAYKEKKAFKDIVSKRALAERRRAFAEEKQKVAREEGIALARKKSFGSKAKEYLYDASKKPLKKVPVREVIRKVSKRKPVKIRRIKKVSPRKVQTTYRDGGKPFGFSDLF